MNSHILPDNIKKIDGREVPDRIKVIYDYIRYMREQMDFWGSCRSNEIQNLSSTMEAMFEVSDDTLHITTRK